MSDKISEYKQVQIVGLAIRMRWNETDSFGGREMPSYRFLLMIRGRRYEVTFTGLFRDCSSGWSTAISYGMTDLKCLPKYKHFGVLHYVPLNNMFGTLEITNDRIWRFETKRNVVFFGSSDGGDEYYPTGCFHVDLSLFRPTKRCNRKINEPSSDVIADPERPRTPSNLLVRHVYVLFGPTLTGKSDLASLLRYTVTVYETDSTELIPETLFHNDVVVVGNKFRGQLKVVIDVLKKAENQGMIRIIYVEFSPNAGEILA